MGRSTTRSGRRWRRGGPEAAAHPSGAIGVARSGSRAHTTTPGHEGPGRRCDRRCRRPRCRRPARSRGSPRAARPALSTDSRETPIAFGRAGRLGREQGAQAIDLERAAFDHEPGPPDRTPERQDSAATAVAVPGRVFAAPGVEGPVERADPWRRRARRWPDVAHPHVVGADYAGQRAGPHERLEPLAQELSVRLRCATSSTRSERQRPHQGLEPALGVRDSRARWSRQPGDPGGRVRLPLGRHAQPARHASARRCASRSP